MLNVFRNSIQALSTPNFRSPSLPCDPWTLTMKSWYRKNNNNNKQNKKTLKSRLSKKVKIVVSTQGCVLRVYIEENLK